MYLYTLIAVFSIVVYLFVRTRNGEENFELNLIEQKSYLKAISTYTRSSILVLDRYERIKFANHRFLNLYRLEAEDLEGRSPSETALPDDFVEFIELDKDNASVSDPEDPSKKMQLYKHPVRTDEGYYIGKLVLIGYELDVQKVNPDDPNEIQMEKLSHNLKTPLNAIMGYSEMLLKAADLNEEQEKYLQTISENSSVLLKQINDLLDEKTRKSKSSSVVGTREISKILIVDDVSINRTLLKIMLERHGYELLEARNGKEAIDKAQTEKPDLILMDITMPVMDGLEALEIIRNSGNGISEIPIIAVTATSGPGKREKIISKGFDAYLQKPFKEQELMELISN